ncbi:hypothetical protein, partial [Phyllobacterium calauticae]|uniref:hypothetical protein n=1 Tax=Phyllobacterium calauticae TaxID=2817027 RepID=UPI001CBCEC00
MAPTDDPFQAKLRTATIQRILGGLAPEGCSSADGARWSGTILHGSDLITQTTHHTQPDGTTYRYDVDVRVTVHKTRAEPGAQL